jgi:hypothetical protein
MSLMMPDGRSWTTSLNPTGSNPYKPPASWPAGQPQQQTQQPSAPQTKQSKSMDFSVYAPGRAQPTQAPSLGTAYGQSNTQGSPRSQGTIYAGGTPDWRNVGQPQQNPFANMQPGVYTPDGFTPANNPLQAQANAIAQRAAFVQQTNQALLPYQAANFTNQNFGPPQFDIAGMRAQANQMVQDGFYNPFQRYFAEQDALNQIGMQAPPSLYGPQPMQADPYQQWLATLPGYQPRDQWMAQQPQATAVPAQPLPGTPDQRGEPRARGWMDSDSEQSGPTPRRPILRSQESRLGAARAVQQPSQGTPYGRGDGPIPDLDKDGIDDRQQYGSPQEAVAARDLRAARNAAAQKLGYRAADQIDIASTLLNTGAPSDRPQSYYGVMTLDSPNAYLSRADRVVERLGLLENAGATITPAERAAAEWLAAVLRNPVERSYENVGKLAEFDSRVKRAEQALRSATEEGNRWREFSAYEKQWGSPTITPPPAAPVNASVADPAARLSKEEQAQLHAAQSTMHAYHAKTGSRGGGYDQISMADREAATPERYHAAIQIRNELLDKGKKIVAADPVAQKYIRERDAGHAADMKARNDAQRVAEAGLAQQRSAWVSNVPDALQAAMLSQIATLPDGPSRQRFGQLLRESNWKGPVDGSFTGPWT